MTPDALRRAVCLCFGVQYCFPWPVDTVAGCPWELYPAVWGCGEAAAHPRYGTAAAGLLMWPAGGSNASLCSLNHKDQRQSWWDIHNCNKSPCLRSGLHHKIQDTNNLQKMCVSELCERCTYQQPSRPAAVPPGSCWPEKVWCVSGCLRWSPALWSPWLNAQAESGVRCTHSPQPDITRRQRREDIQRNICMWVVAPKEETRWDNDMQSNPTHTVHFIWLRYAVDSVSYTK